MRDDQIPRIKARSDALEKSFDDLLKILGKISDPNGRAFDISRAIPATDSSISDLRARMASIAGLIRKFDDKGGALTPVSDFVSLVNAGNAVTNSISQIEENLKGQIISSGGLQSISYDNFNFTAINGSSIPFDGYFKSLFDSVESYTSAFQTVFQAASPSRAAFNFTSAGDALTKVIGRTNETREALQVALNAAKKELDKVSSNQSAFEAILADIRAKQSLLSDQASQATDSIAIISARSDEASNLGAMTSELKDRIQAYNVEFESFQKQLETIRDSNTSGSKILSDLIKKFRDQEQSFEGLIEKSNQMLSGSTVAGLASEFGTIRSDLDVKLTAAHTSFNKAIAVLAVFSVPLMLFVFAPFIVAFLPDNKNLVGAIAGMAAEQSSWHYIGQVLARFVILLPAIWYVSFCSARYNSLFKLKEHYSYKYSMAVAVDGFKKQAPEYESMIAALVLEQLAFNPVDKLGKHHDGPEDPPHPIAKLMLDTLRGASKPQEP